MTYEPGLSPPKDTYTPLEIDILPHHILNRRRLKPRHLHQDFTELLHTPLDPNEKLVPAVKELWEDEKRRRAAKELSLSETAMLPSGGMGGHTMAELGYKVPGQPVVENKGGDWKRSDEMWELLQNRMEEEGRKKGKLTFEKFTMDVSAGKDGEKRKYDRVSQFLVEIRETWNAELTCPVDYDHLRGCYCSLAKTSPAQVHSKVPKVEHRIITGQALYVSD